MFQLLTNFIEYVVRSVLEKITDYLPVKVIRDDNGIPFLYRYHLFTLGYDGPGLCIHHFVKSDPDRGYHDHPWSKGLSFILCGGYKERILNLVNKQDFVTYNRERWSFNSINGKEDFHRVILDENKDAWTIFMFNKRSKIWGMISLKGKYNPMSNSISDADGGWWNTVDKGLSINNHLDHNGCVLAMVDIAVISESDILLIKRSKEPFKKKWALPGGRIEQKDTTILDAAKRELKEETSLTGLTLKHIQTSGNNYRDDRGFVLSNLYLTFLDKKPTNVKAGSDAIDYKWFPVNDLPDDIAFDHQQLIQSIDYKIQNVGYDNFK